MSEGVSEGGREGEKGREVSLCRVSDPSKEEEEEEEEEAARRTELTDVQLGECRTRGFSRGLVLRGARHVHNAKRTSALL